MGTETIGRAYRCIGVTGATLLISTSAGLGAYFGFTAGAHVHFAIGCAFAAAALGGELMKPLAVLGALECLKVREWGRAAACAILAAVCVLYSTAAELSLAAGSRGDLAASRRADADADKAARSKRTRAESELAILPPARPAEVLAPLIAKMYATGHAGDCERPQSGAARRVCGEIADLRSEAARADRRKQLEAAVADASRPATGRPVVGDADPLAAVLSAYGAAMGFKLEPDAILPWLALIPVLLLEIGSALALVVVRSLFQGAGQPTGHPAEGASRADTGSDTGGPKVGAVAVIPPAGAAAKGKAGRPPRLGTRIVELLRERGGRVDGGQRAMAKALGASKSSVNDVLRRMALAGEVIVTAGRTGTRIELAAA